MTGLIGWWPLHEQNGSRAHDLSGNGNHGTVNGATQGVAGKMGLTSYSFDGNDDNISNNFNTPVPFTVSCWVRKTSTTTGDMIFDHDATRVYLGYENKGSNGYEFNVYDGTHHTITSGVTAENEWIHLAGISDGNTAKMYVNGSLAGTASHTEIDKTDTGTYIASSTNNSSYFEGYISDVRIYDRALTSNEIKTLYRQGNQEYTQKQLHNGKDPRAISRWKLDGNADDSWGSNNGSTNGGLSFSSDSIRGDSGNFDGNDDYIDCGNGLVNYDSDFAISFWIANPNFNHHVIDERTDGYSGFSFKTVNNENIWFNVGDGSNGVQAVSSSDISTGWHHIVGIWNETETKAEIFINGVREDSGSNTSIGDSSASDNFYIGCKSGGTGTPSDYIKAQIDDVRVYNRALKPWEIQELYQWGTGGIDMRKQTVNARGDH